MKKIFLAFGLGGLILIGLTSHGVGGRLNAAPRDVRIKISLNQPVYKKEAPIGVAVLIYSAGGANLTFPSAKIYDLILETDGKKVWQWSDERMFAQSLVTKELKSNEPLLYCEVIDPSALKLDLNPGEYTLTPILCLANPVIGTPARFVIK